MGRPQNHLEIVLNTNTLELRSGSGSDAEPTTLRGCLILTLFEATPFKDITMRFWGVSRVSNVPFNSSTILRTHQKDVFFAHDWSFLEGDHKHASTLKAGRHVFPFHLHLDDSLPSSLSCHSGLATIKYKLRATAVRSAFSTNLHASASVRLIRSFPPESAQYQQASEVENTWPEKLMYSLLIPHKAWAAGDTITTLAKFSPLVKGVRVTAITTTIQEHLRTFTKAGSAHEETRTIAVARHEFHGSRAYTSQLIRPTTNTSPWSFSIPDTPAKICHNPSLFPALDILDPLSPDLFHCVPITTSSTLETSSEFTELGDSDVVTTLPLTLPAHATPSHALSPAIVSHRLRWRILLANLDGHISELRLAFRVHILDAALLPDVHSATAPSHALIFGDEHNVPRPVDLPTYHAHILDRACGLPEDPPPESSCHPTSPALDCTTPDSTQTGHQTSRVPSPEPATGSRNSHQRQRRHSVFSLRQFTRVLHRNLAEIPGTGRGSGMPSLRTTLSRSLSKALRPVPPRGLPRYEDVSTSDVRGATPSRPPARPVC